ncbi:phospholipase D gamma 1-like [Macadamia integrifolia]|uniref:phospholipase D gamma 1-like n=1 Tax=Macadamia integrifolia TaxID=60698 RepID=UPI001C4ED151|nr:phospholipase D gamma 1-like [Macadamia integrifolia]
MANYSPYGYPDPNRYPYPPPNSDSYPPSASPFPPHPYPFPYPYPSSHSFSYPQPPQQPPPPYHSHSGPLDYHYPPPSHSAPYPYPYPSPNPHYPSPPPPPPVAHDSPSRLQYHGSFQYDSSHYQPQQSNPYPPPESHHMSHSRANSFSCYAQQDSSTSAGVGSSLPHEGVGSSSQSHSSIYPPIDDLLANVQLSDQPSAPPITSPPSISNMPPKFHSQSARYDNRIDMDGYRTDSFSSVLHTHSGPLYPPQSPYNSSPSFEGSHHSQSLQIVPFQSFKGSLKVLLLHGNLDIWVRSAKNLPNMDMFHKTVRDVLDTISANITNKIEGHMNHKMTSDPYVTVSVSKAVVARTFVFSNNENPVWLQHFNVPVAHYAAEVHFLVKDNDVVGSQLIGTVRIPVEQIYSGAKVEGSFPILNGNGKPCKPGAELSLSIQYIPIDRLTIYHNGVGSGPDYPGVFGTYFPLRKGGKVTLYQDAHVPDGCLSTNLKLDNGMLFEHGKCWYDICDAISQARRLIYITGWSVFHIVRLVRDAAYASDRSDCTLGDLLKTKSQEGVRVLLLVWDDPTSRNILGYKTDGIMQTHDEETRQFFKHSLVQVLLCPRSAGKRHSWVKQQEVGAIYTHHQKTVIVDADAGYYKRKIIAFVGGLDLCDGRYDTPGHPLFRTLQTVHKDDYHNPNFTGPTAGCPREPWHDLHCKIDGPAAYDVLTNFEERWRKASRPRGIKKLKKSNDDALLRLDRIPEINGVLDTSYLRENDPETWHVQVFRSIDSTSVKGFPKDPREATSKNLVCGKNVLIDMSIHTAYVKAIRSAQNFIYIENQYFLGSSYNWSQHKDLGANNLIPMEIALKIADKIRANERFATYIVIPMWPEGAPTGTATQRILFWQNKTMQMMYEIIYKALEEVELEKTYTPEDYLNFFCLGNREALDANYIPDVQSPTPANTPQASSQKSRRFMIYVHSKGMIVDDEYVILGSANINQRSMEGTRDTEIAMGAYQPLHTWGRKGSNPCGQIYGYRMSLWEEHIGGLEECFKHPESLDCVRRVRSLGEQNWRQFAADEVIEMKGHLLKYPVKVDPKGKVKPLHGCESFPDLGGTIVGTFLAIQENLTI